MGLWDSLVYGSVTAVLSSRLKMGKYGRKKGAGPSLESVDLDQPVEEEEGGGEGGFKGEVEGKDVDEDDIVWLDKEEDGGEEEWKEAGRREKAMEEGRRGSRYLNLNSNLNFMNGKGQVCKEGAGQGNGKKQEGRAAGGGGTGEGIWEVEMGKEGGEERGGGTVGTSTCLTSMAKEFLGTASALAPKPAAGAATDVSGRGRTNGPGFVGHAGFSAAEKHRGDGDGTEEEEYRAKGRAPSLPAQASLSTSSSLCLPAPGRRHARPPPLRAASSNALLSPALPPALPPPTPPLTASIFVSTYNCGSLPPSALSSSLPSPSFLHAWIPLHHHLYIIGVQELKGLQALKQLLHTHLGGPAAFQMYGQEISVVGNGTALAERLGAIALLVYARTEDVERGVFEMTAVPKAGGQQVLQGKNLLVCRAGNKGAVCLPFRYHQSTLVVAAAHLPADGSRRSKVEKRNANLR